ncbi:MAG: nucleoside deaminase [Defluviitaleaceae bacterium]|nr:nucleoside deaminase [Defluviitaleaceae bacterium]
MSIDIGNDWNNIEKPWQIALELAWESFKCGSIPIAAVITDISGNIISTGRNKIFENDQNSAKNRKMRHAEMNSLYILDYDKHPDIRKYIMYTTIEPCPMCMGSIVMSDIRNVKIGAADPWAGAAEICKLPYIADKNMNISFAGGIVENMALILLLYHEANPSNYRKNFVFEAFGKRYPKQAALAEKLSAQNALGDFAENNTDFRQVFDYIVNFAI